MAIEIMSKTYFHWYSLFLQQMFKVFCTKVPNPPSSPTVKAGLHWQLWEAISGGDATLGSFSCSATQLWEIEKFLI
jgi:hypothetical protein